MKTAIELARDSYVDGGRDALLSLLDVVDALAEMARVSLHLMGRVSLYLDDVVAIIDEALEVVESTRHE